MKKKILRLILGASLCLGVALSLTGCQNSAVEAPMADTYEDMRVALTEQGIFMPEESKLPFVPVSWEVTWADETAKDRAVGYLVTGSEVYEETEINYSLIVDTPTEPEEYDWAYDLVIWRGVAPAQDGVRENETVFYRGEQRYRLRAAYPDKESTVWAIYGYLKDRLMDGTDKMMRQEGAEDYGYIEVPLDTTWWEDAINGKGYGPVGVIRGDKMYRLMGSEFSQIVHNNGDPDKLLADRAYWFGPDGTAPTERPEPVPLPENAAAQGATETFVCNDFGHALELQISNVREIRTQTAYEQTYDVYVVYPGAMAAVINADMMESVSYHEGECRFLVPDWSFYTHSGYRFGIYDGMEPVPITEELCGIIDEGFVPIQFELYQGDTAEDEVLP